MDIGFKVYSVAGVDSNSDYASMLNLPNNNPTWVKSDENGLSDRVTSFTVVKKNITFSEGFSYEEEFLVVWWNRSKPTDAEVDGQVAIWVAEAERFEGDPLRTEVEANRQMPR